MLLDRMERCTTVPRSGQCKLVYYDADSEHKNAPGTNWHQSKCNPGSKAYERVKPIRDLAPRIAEKSRPVKTGRRYEN